MAALPGALCLACQPDEAAPSTPAGAAQAIERVNDLDPEILEAQQGLFFHLQQQRLIELIRQGQLAEALHFAQVGWPARWRCGCTSTQSRLQADACLFALPPLLRHPTTGPLSW